MFTNFYFISPAESAFLENLTKANSKLKNSRLGEEYGSMPNRILSSLLYFTGQFFQAREQLQQECRLDLIRVTLENNSGLILDQPSVQEAAQSIRIFLRHYHCQCHEG